MGTMPQAEGDTQALTAIEGTALAIGRPPAEVLAEARDAAAALQGVLAQKTRKVLMNGEQYLEFEDWQTLGRFYGITAREDGDPEFVELGAARGFKASAVALHRGEIISRATAYCLDDEEKWGSRTKYEWLYACRDGSVSAEDPGPDNIVWVKNPNKPGKKMPKRERVASGDERVPLFQLASMAQTRANAKVLRNVLSWVAVLAGYRPTPAEEIQDMPVPQRVVEAQATVPREPGEDFPDAGEEAYERHGVAPPAPDLPKPPARTAGPCPKCGNSAQVIWSKRTPGALYCFTHKEEWTPGGAQ